MADLCGPSNALQNFQKHSSVDRTLQQDRLQNRVQPNQAFRSNPASNAASIDREFETFQAGQPLQEQFHGNFNFGGPSQSFVQPGPATWADDFQRLNISSIPSYLQRAPQQSHAAQSSWHQDFLQQNHQTRQEDHGYNVPFERLSSIVPRQGQYQPMFGGGMYLGTDAFQTPLQHEPQIPQPQTHQQVESFDEAAFARAFDEAAQAELAAQNEASQREEVLLNESAENIMKEDLIYVDPALDQPRIGADLIHDPQGKADQHANEDADALSRTAGELLNKVSGNTSEKFANSQFLELMRQLRDKEVVVEGDRIVEAGDNKQEQQIAF